VAPVTGWNRVPTRADYQHLADLAQKSADDARAKYPDTAMTRLVVAFHERSANDYRQLAERAQ
jgi:hypothetical protein